ncbi:MAG: alanine racemase [Oscillospiraceae bacterium]
MDFLKRTWAEIDLDALAANLHEIQKRLSPSTKLMAIVKADAYGHGDIFIARELEKLGITDFGVSNLEEALSLRKDGIEGEILILGVTPASFAKQLADYDITQTVCSSSYAAELCHTATESNVRVKCHIKLDTGMGRIGFVVGDDMDPTAEIAEVCALPHLHFCGIFSHFSSSDDKSEAGISYTQKQMERFDRTIASLEAKGIHFQTKHLQNSAGILNLPNCRYDLVRAGIIMYGLPVAALPGCEIPLTPVMSIRSMISMVKYVHAGDCISYSRKFTAEKERRLATVPIGYADGYLRAFSGKASMIVNGHYAKIVGSICMDQLMLDVTDIPDVKDGDIATVIGTDGACSICFDDLAELANTINYEMVCLVGKRVPRVYLKNGKVVGVVDYISK